MGSEKTNTIYRTMDYHRFRLLHGNRAISDERVKKIIDSINNVGYVSSPLLCNEHMEIIDGQGRYTALKRLGLPVEYFVVPGLTIKECISLNINQENWKVKDFIQSYADQGSRDYKYLLELTKKYPEFPVRLLTFATIGSASTEKIVRTGAFKCTETQYNNAIKALDYSASFEDLLKNAPNMTGILTWYYMALVFSYNLPGVDNKEMYSKTKKGINMVVAAGTLDAAAKVLEAIYNKGRKGSDRVYIAAEYDKYAARSRFKSRP